MDVIASNLPAILGIVGALFAWWRSTSAKDKANGIVALAEAFARQAVTDLLGDPDAKSKAATFIENRIIGGLATRLGVSTADLEQWMPLVHPVIEHAVADLLAELEKRNTAAAAKLPDAMAKLQEQIAAILPSINKTEADALAAGKKFADEMVERVLPDAPAPASSP